MSEVREEFLRMFPSYSFGGDITLIDREVGPDDDEYPLVLELKNRAWAQVDESFVREHHTEIGLLLPEAFAAFFPAWLCFAAESSDAEDELRDFVAYRLIRDSRIVKIWRMSQWLRS